MSIETPAALFTLSDFAEHTDGSGEAWAAFQEVDAHITALQAEVERLTAERDEARKSRRYLHTTLRNIVTAIDRHRAPGDEDMRLARAALEWSET